MKNRAGIWVNTGIFLIILLSFFTFSENYFPLLNSDMAVNILMTPAFSLPHDIYFWGQDRAGNLIPLIAHVVYIVTGWQPVVIVSIVHYLILAAGFWALSYFVRTAYGRIILALVWFFPPWHFIEFLLILYGVQASCAILALNFLTRSFGARMQWKCILWLSLSCLMFILAVWVSDMILADILALVILGVLYFRAAGRDPQKLLSWRSMRVPAFFVMLWAIAGVLLLHYARIMSTPVQTYHEGFLAAPSAIFKGLNIVVDSMISVFTFSSKNNIESVFAWSLMAALLFLLITGRRTIKTGLKITENPWFYFFLIEALITVSAVLLSRWVASNGTGRRYFTTFYISSWICLILWLENLPKTRWKHHLQIVFALVVITGSLSGSSGFYYPGIKPSRIRVLSALKSMGNIGIIAEYWNSYLAASPDPIHIKATPHDKDYVRNPDLAEEVLNQPKIYLIKDGWLETFPDTIVQFGRTLKKCGRSIHIADAWLNRYEIVRQ